MRIVWSSLLLSVSLVLSLLPIFSAGSCPISLFHQILFSCSPWLCFLQTFFQVQWPLLFPWFHHGRNSQFACFVSVASKPWLAKSRCDAAQVCARSAVTSPWKWTWNGHNSECCPRFSVSSIIFIDFVAWLHSCFNTGYLIPIPIFSWVHCISICVWVLLKSFGCTSKMEDKQLVVASQVVCPIFIYISCSLSYMVLTLDYTRHFLVLFVCHAFFLCLYYYKAVLAQIWRKRAIVLCVSS